MDFPWEFKVSTLHVALRLNATDFVSAWTFNASASDSALEVERFSRRFCSKCMLQPFLWKYKTTAGRTAWKFVAAALDFSLEVEGACLRYCLQHQCPSVRCRLEIECISLRLCLETQSPSHSFHLAMYSTSLRCSLIILCLSLGVCSGIRGPSLRICLAL